MARAPIGVGWRPQRLTLTVSRVLWAGVDSSGRGLQYRGYVDCVLKILRSEGPRGFYKGVTASWLRVGPHSVLCMNFWSYLRTALGGSRHGEDAGSESAAAN